MIKIYGPDWKTSLNGDLAFVMYVCSVITTFVVVTPTTPKWIAAVTAIAGVISGLGRSYVGRQQIDSGKVVVHAPDAVDAIAIVPSHEVPDEKGLKPVTPQPK